MRLVRKAPCPDLAALIPDNDCRYMVLTRILRTPCRMTVTDDSNVILCHSAYPYPIWYWSKGEATDEEVDAVWQLLQPEIGKWDTVTEAGNPFSVNLLEDAAMHMIAHAKKDNVSLQVTRRLNATFLSLRKRRSADPSISARRRTWMPRWNCSRDSMRTRDLTRRTVRFTGRKRRCTSMRDASFSGKTKRACRSRWRA